MISLLFCLAVLLFFFVVGFFIPWLGGVLLLVGFPLAFFDSLRNFKKAKNNGGYYFTDKAIKKQKKLQELADAERIILVDDKSNHSYDSYGDIDDFFESLSIVWTDHDSDDVIDIEFSYKNSIDERSRRNIILDTVSINNKNEVYLRGFDMTAEDDRTFKLKRITSKILFDGRKYSKKEFLDDVLYLDSSEFL
ncbi:hypothetical protein [Salmonella enterica]|uniref:WYL domain-containing protein n=2 Tax=Salmonella enterica TaxID=28901 RepID=A0A3F3IWH6_SALER|nr:hypothetical protein [Salmonella enterica]EAA7903287.1 hypothetical protein [Salmonella enterica]EAA9129050.1 hypothetical protein [Salmonella enterica]EAM8740607.1 hypothetical protein [Salmonella enterica]EAS2301117.1 hypothetical protein [Salmonella enterica]EAZ9077879.1 WYL domain-containing protein [Salmonella enterica]